jgi:hypothetical protein
LNATNTYALVLGLVTILLTGSIGVFNYSTDPYLLFGFDKANADQLSRIDQFNHMRVTKPWYMKEVKATAVIVGSSRSARLHPEHTSWVNDRGYNLAAPGMTPQEILSFIQHAHAIEPLSKVMIGLDYEAFIRSTPVVRQGFEPGRMASNKEGLFSISSKLQYINDLADSLFSIQAMSNSLAARTGISPPGRRYFMDGTWETTTHFLTGRSGYVYVAKNVVIAHRTGTLDTRDNLLRLAETLRFCHNNNIDTRIFFTPTHVFFVDLWRRLGDEAIWLVAALNEHVAAEKGDIPFPLWGFSHAKGIVNEPIYRKKDTDKAWYDDGVHTRVPLGKIMMDDVWGETAIVGRRLHSENIEVYLEEIFSLSDQYNRENRQFLNNLRKDIGLH